VHKVKCLANDLRNLELKRQQIQPAQHLLEDNNCFEVLTDEEIHEEELDLLTLKHLLKGSRWLDC
jgi:hypothetical protein